MQLWLTFFFGARFGLRQRVLAQVRFRAKKRLGIVKTPTYTLCITFDAKTMTRLFSALSGLAIVGLAALPLAASAQDYTVRVPVLAATHAPPDHQL